MDTITRRELFRRLGRAAIVGPILLATREPQADMIYRISRLFGNGSVIGRWLRQISWRW